MYCLNSKDNTMVLSETLDENAIQTLLDLFIANKFSKPCDEWLAMKTNISDIHSRELTKKQQNAVEELTAKEHKIRHVFYDAIVGDVMVFFPCVLSVVSPSR